MTPQQEQKLRWICAGYQVEFRPDHYQPQFDLPQGWVAGWIGGPAHSGWPQGRRTIYVGVSPEGAAHS